MRAPLSACVLVALMVSSACIPQTATTPTEVVVDVDAEPGVKARATSFRIVVDGSGDLSDASMVVHSLDQSIKAAQLPLRVALLPLFGNPSRRFVLTATALDADQGFVAQARLASGYVADDVRYARMLIEDACLDTSCDVALDTCASGHCVSAQPDATCFSRDPKHPTLVNTPGSVRQDAGP